MSDTRDLINRPIPGVTAKLVISLILIISAVMGVYFEVKEGRKQSLENFKLLEKMQIKDMQDEKIDDARMDAIELSVRETKIRMDFMERFIEGYNKQK
jgi:hypothetical protein